MFFRKIKTQIFEHSLFFKNTFWLYLLQIAQYVLPFIVFPYLTRVLHPEHFAVYAYVSAFLGIIGVIVNFGFNLFGTKEVSAVRNNIKEVSRIVGQITYARLIVAIFMLFVVLIASQFIDILRENLFFTILFYIGIVLNSLLPDFVFQSFENMRPLTVRYLLTKLLSIAFILALVRKPDDLVLLSVVNVLCGIVSYVWTISCMNKMFSINTDWSATFGIVKQLKNSSMYCLSELSGSLFSGFITIMIGIIFDDKNEVSYWSIAITVIGAVQALYSPITNSLYPHMINCRDLRFALRLGVICAPILIIGTILFIVLSDFIVSIIGGAEYAPAAKVLVWLSPILPVSFYSIFIGWPILGALGQVKKLTMSVFVSGFVNVFLICIIASLNVSSLAVICFIRCLIECLLLVLRIFALYGCLKNKTI